MIILFKFLLLIFIAVLIAGILTVFRIYRSVRNITDRFKGGGTQQGSQAHNQRRSGNKESVIDHRNPHTANRKIFKDGEGEYVDYEEVK